MNRENPSAVWARVFVDELHRAGVRELCVAPGSRSTPLVLAAAAHGGFRMFPILDERSAGFFALGVGKASGRPGAVITTSGTAAANLYPAVVEAAQGEVPLLVLTADRPHRLRDSDANQAMDQLRLFGAFPRAFFEVAPARVEGADLRHLRALAARAVALCRGTPRGPVHLNFPFEKPLEPRNPGVDEPGECATADPGAAGGREGEEPFVNIRPREAAVSDEDLTWALEIMGGAGRGLIVAGPVPNPGEVGPAVAMLGAATGFPVLADPLSGARFAPAHGAQIVGGYDLFLQSPDARRALAPDLVLRVGASPTSSALLKYLGEQGKARQIVVDDGHRWKDHPATAHDYLPAAPAPLLLRWASKARRSVEPEWRTLWEEASSRTRTVLADLPPGELLEGEIAAAVLEAVPEGTNLLVASSMPVRDLDAFGSPGPKGIRVFGNRGASGIDGLVSTTAGIAASGGGSGGPTVGILGDLAFFHDMNGLMVIRDQDLPVLLVVVNNDGGGIFHTLPVREHEPAFTRFFATPHGLSFGKAAELYGLPYETAETLEDFLAALDRALERKGPGILEVRTRRKETHARRREVVAAVVEAMKSLASDERSKGDEET